jgi:hypothetical protein
MTDTGATFVNASTYLPVTVLMTIFISNAYGCFVCSEWDWVNWKKYVNQKPIMSGLDCVCGAKIFTSIYDLLSFGPKNLFDFYQPVVFGNSLPTTWCPRLDVSCPQSNYQVCDKVVGGFARAMGNEHAPTIAKCKICPGKSQSS